MKLPHFEEMKKADIFSDTGLNKYYRMAMLH
jgi:hypothetical protein